MQLTQLQRTANQREVGQLSRVELCRYKRAFNARGKRVLCLVALKYSISIVVKFEYLSGTENCMALRSVGDCLADGPRRL